jgi:hypothetical protein
MPLSYDYQADFTTTRDQVRFLIGDTDMTVGVPLLADEEIAALYTANGSIYGAAIAACEGLIARFTRAIDASEGNASASMSQLAAQYRQLRDDLRRKSAANVNPAAAFTGSTLSNQLEPAFTRQLGDPAYNVPTPTEATS